MGLAGRGARGKPKTRVETPSQTVDAVSSWAEPRRTRAGRIITFCESLPITKGLLEGQQMRLLPAQKRFIRAVYGNSAPGGRIRLAVLSAPRGNGKLGCLRG
jgi:phage terminase large subunit-like protein